MYWNVVFRFKRFLTESQPNTQITEVKAEAVKAEDALSTRGRQDSRLLLGLSDVLSLLLLEVDVAG